MRIIEFLRARFKEEGYKAIVHILSPTMLYAAFCKSLVADEPEQLRELIISRNWQYFLITISFLVLSVFLGSDLSVFESLIFAPIFLYALSRINEIFVAFIKDASSHLRTKEHSSTLMYHERIPLAMRSYVELILLFGLVYFGLNSWFGSLSCSSECHKCAVSILQATYFSGVTITTLGYGEMTPNNLVAQAFTIYEVLCGFTLIVVSFTVYVSKSISENEAE